MGGSSSGKIVNERSAMQMTAVYACVRILSEAIAGLPLHLYRYKEDGGKDKAVDHPLYLLLHDEPNPEMSSFVFRETLMTHLLLYGNAYAQIIRNGKGEVVGLYPLMANKMSVNRDTNGQLYYQWSPGSSIYYMVRDSNGSANLGNRRPGNGGQGGGGAGLAAKSASPAQGEDGANGYGGGGGGGSCPVCWSIRARSRTRQRSVMHG